MKKMFNIMRTTLVLALLVMVSSCLKVDIVLPEQEATNVSLSFISRDIAQTRAAAGIEKGDGSENVVESIDVFFYDEDAGDDEDDEDALYHMRIEKNDLVASTDNSTDNINYSYTASIPTDVINEIFGENTTCNKIYAIANISANTEFNGTSVNALNATILKTDFSQSQTSFVMSGESSNITFDSSKRKIEGTVELSRSASKIELIIKQVLDIPVTDEYGNQKKDSDGNLVVWNADTENMIVSLQKGVNKSYIDGYCELSAEKDYFDTGDVKLVKDGDNGWKHATPFYTYPSNWEEEDATETYLKLIVPWSKSDAPRVFYNTYYKIPISETGLVRNTYYKIELTVGRLGTFDEGEDVVLTPASYYIYNWSTNTIRTELLDYRYLVVDQKEYTIYNQEELYIPFSSSHDVEIVSITCTQEDLSVVGAEPKEVTDYTLSVVNRNVYFKNNLENDMSKEGFDFTPITLTFTLRHKDNAKYNEVITVTQYPAIYAEAKMNSDYASGGANDGVTGIGGKFGFVWVNGYNSDEGSNPTGNSFFGTVHGIYNYDDDDEQITNPNMYVLTITSVEGTDYVVGDPRVYENATTFINNYNWCPAPYFTNNSVSSDSNHKLTYYYPTDYTDRTYNMIAPKFRVASAYSVTMANGVTNINTAKGRCASYQEDGYPAGRWRMPTKAEYEFIVYQSYKGRIPTLFQSNTDYWCAHGYGQPNSQGKVTMNGNVNATTGNLTLQGGASIRCVYDEWYWEDYLQGKDKIPFTWGDMPR